MLCRRAREAGKYTYTRIHNEGILNVIIKLAEHENNPIEHEPADFYTRKMAGGHGGRVDPNMTCNNNNNKDIYLRTHR